MSSRRGGGAGGRGGGRAGEGGGRGGRRYGGRGRGGRGRDGGDEALQAAPSPFHPAPTAAAAYSQPSQPQERPKPADQPSSSSSAVVSKQLGQKLVIGEPSGAAVSGSPPATAEVPSLPRGPPVSSKAFKYPRRPGFGTVGRKCIVRANHFLVQVADNDLHHYDVAITPEVQSRGVNRNVISTLVKLHGESHLGRRRPAYDGRKSLYTAGALPFTSKDFTIKLTEKDENGKVKKERDFKVVIKLAGRPDLHNLQEFLRGRYSDLPQETIQVLDVVLRESPSENYITVARSFFSPLFGEIKEMGEGLECWRGYYQSLRPTQMGLSLNIDIAATSFYKAIPIVDFVAEYLNLREISRPLSDIDRSKVKKVLRGLRIETTHRGSPRRYKITGISTKPMNELMFPNENGTMISVVQYFRERYHYTLRLGAWPCLQTGTDSRPTYLPMEVCKIVEGQRYSKKLNERQVTAILRSTCQRPADRERSIVEMVNHNDYNRDSYANEFGIRVLNQLVSVDARILPAPRLKYHESGREKFVNPEVGQWNMIHKKVVNGATVESWACISFSRLPSDAVSRFCSDLVQMCNNIGMTFNWNPVINIKTVSSNRIDAALKEVYSQSTQVFARQGAAGKQLQILIVVLPDFSGSYGKIKRICETELGIVSQCCLPKHVGRSNKQYLENVALKINVKAGGQNTVLEDAVSRRIPLVTDKRTIIFGADVTHPPPGEDMSASIAAVVASMDWPDVTKYRGLVSAQAHRQEMIRDLYTVDQDPKRGTVFGGMIRDLLLAFYKANNGSRPDRIIFYRDGVSEGQFSHVLLNEMDAIRRACASLEEGYLPPVTFVVVQKRHHTRLFPQMPRRELTDRSGNILPGTVVDTKICHPFEFDFYLCSHAGIQGTSRPTHYHVLFDENGFSADTLQMLTNNLCYTYARCTRSVSVVPPAYYAHLAAFRARYYMEGEVSDDGSAPAEGGTNTRQMTPAVRPLPQIKDSVKDVMFYC